MMGVIKTTVIIILIISFGVFVALFGRLPVFRKTPIGFLHRVIWIHIPAGLLAVDNFLTGGLISRSLGSLGNYLMNEAHPLVLIFFLCLQIGGEVLFIPTAWPLVSNWHRIFMIGFSSLPYTFLYLCSTTTSNITPANHEQAMQAYPYDYALFHPGYFCRTCNFAKPARSKHCPLCKACVQKQDHHCIWINNCVGRNNYVWFLLLLVATSALLLYGACLGYGILNHVLQERFVPAALTRGSVTSKKWATRFSWSEYFDVWLWAIGSRWPLGATTLLCAMAFPLSTGFFLYHVYLIWAGMTTNESAKWADWREDVADKLVYRASLAELRKEFPPPPAEIAPEVKAWPTKSQWWVILTSNGQQPTKPRLSEAGRRHPTDEYGMGMTGEGEADMRWEQVYSMAELENIYDLGMFDNLKDALLNRG